jgi:hypothetical protein
MQSVGSVDRGGNTDSLTFRGSGLYFTNGFHGDPVGEFRLDRLPLDGSAPASLATSVVPIYASFIDDTVYFSEVAPAEGGNETSILRAPVPDGPRDVVVDAAQAGAGRALVTDQHLLQDTSIRLRAPDHARIDSRRRMLDRISAAVNSHVVRRFKNAVQRDGSSCDRRPKIPRERCGPRRRAR